jgi:putative ABC transport system permease protein
MKLRRGARLSLRALSANRVRALLAVGIVAFGVGVMLITGALASGADRQVADDLERLGTNLLVVRPAQVPQSVLRPRIGGRARTLRLSDHDALARLRDVAVSAPGADGAVRVKWGRTSTVATAMGTTPAFQTIRSFQVAAGRFIEEEDVQRSRRVAVLGARVQAALFGAASAVGEQVSVSGIPFTVVGALRPKGVSLDGGDEDNLVVVPVSTALRRMLNRTWLSAIFVRARDASVMEGTVTALERELGARHATKRGPGRDFEVQNTAKALASQQETRQLLRRVTNATTILTFIVGGVAIGSVMWLSVAERTPEIGLRLAVGARRRQVVLQFLSEAAMLATAGWAAGMLAGAVLIVLVEVLTSWRLEVPTPTLWISVGLAGGTALGAGAVPALRAAFVSPSEAFRGE